MEQLGIIVRYLEKGVPKERIIELIDCKSITGASIYAKIIQFLTHVNLQSELFRAQTYDDAGNMAGYYNGCAAHLREIALELLTITV